MFLKNKGFTLIEVLIAILVLSLIIVSVTHLITGSVVSTRNRIIMECLVNAANSAIEACRGGININNYRCGGEEGLEIQISINTDCSSITPPLDTWDANCREVRVIATYGSKNHVLTDFICKFWDGR